MNIQELIILNSALSLYINKYGKSHNSSDLELKLKDQLYKSINK